MARSKAKRDVDVPLMRARLRPRWFDDLSPRDLSHVLSLIDMGMDPARTSRDEAVSCRPSSSDPRFAGPYSPQVNTARGNEQSYVTTPLQGATRVSKSKHNKHLKQTKHRKQVPENEDVVQVLENQTQDAAANHDGFYSTGVLYSWQDPSIQLICFCRVCSSTFDRPHQVLAHYWHTHIKQEILSSFTGSKRARMEDLAEDYIYTTALVDDLLERTTAVPNAISGPPSDSVRLISAAFIHWFNVDLSGNTEPYPRIPGLQKSLRAVNQVIAPVTRKSIVP